MAEPKKPQDHKAKKGAVTVRGIKITIPPERLSDWDVVEGVATMQDTDADQASRLVATVQVMKRILADDYERVKAELRAANGGSLDASDMGGFLTEMFEALNPNG